MPKIEFRVSWIYNENWKDWTKLYPFLEERPTLSFDEVWERKKSLELEWRKVENKIFEEISDLTHLNWQSDEILCYLTGKSLAFSDPLTLPVSDLDDDRLIDILTHELFHILFAVEKGNYLMLKDYWSFIDEEYNNESFNTRIHISIHAFHKALILNLFDENRWIREKQIASRFPEYRKSIEIVESEGYEGIIEAFVSRIGE